MWTNGRIDLQPWQAIPDRMVALGLADADGITQVWFVNTRNQLSGGAAAINQAMRICWWARPFTYLYALPGIHALQDWVYRSVANNRHRLPGGTPACAVKRPK